MPTTRTLTTISLITLFSSLLLNILRPSTTMSTNPLPGDSLIPTPEMCYTHSLPIAAPSSVIFPWILQLGKARGGWYLPRSWERLLPKRMHAARSINASWTGLRVGDVVADYGFNEKEDVFEVVEVVREEGVKALVYRSERYGTVFSWAIIVRDLQPQTEESALASDKRDGKWAMSEVTLRFRGRIQRTGWQRGMLVWGGGWMDWMTTWPMLRGLRERCEEEYRSR